MKIFLFWFKFIPPNYIVHLYTWMALSKAHTFAQAQQSPQTNNSNKPSPISNSSALYHSKYNTSHNCFPSRIHFKLYSMINTCHIKKVPWEMNDNVENILFCFVKESVKKIPSSILSSRSAPKVNELYSGPRPILHPGYVEMCWLVFVQFCYQTETQLKKEVEVVIWNSESGSYMHFQTTPCCYISDWLMENMYWYFIDPALTITT